ncbi:MAG: single-stranded DNA-binding protein [Chloroflexi bacterium]|nr:MAG: single-stranded DNA-binding protein [Chloroflexota bacterium]
MAYYVKTIFIGYLGKDAELSVTSSDNEFVKFSVAVNDRNGKTTWYNCMMRQSKYAKSVMPYLVKGKQVLVEGSLSASAYVDKSGEPRVSLTVWVDSVTLLGASHTRDIETDAIEFDEDNNYEYPF